MSDAVSSLSYRLRGLRALCIKVTSAETYFPSESFRQLVLKALLTIDSSLSTNLWETRWLRKRHKVEASDF